MTNDSDLVEVTFACCGEKRIHPFVDLKSGALGFACPICGNRVKYKGIEFVRLMNEKGLDSTHKITLYPVEK